MNVFIGAGAVTTVLASYLLSSGESVVFSVRPGREKYYGAPNRLVMSGNQNLSHPTPPVTSNPDYTQATRVFIGCKHQHLPGIINQLAGKLPKGIPLLPCLNGVSHIELLQREFPNNPVCPITVMFNAQLPAPMAPVLTTSPLIFIDAEASQLLNLFKSAGMLAHQGSVATAWGKLILNLNNAIGALTQSTFKDLLLSPPHRQAALATFDEATAVLTAAHIEFDVPTPVSWRMQRFILRYLPKLAWQIAKKRNQLSDQSYPSMLADINSRNTTEVAQLNGEIVRQAEKLGITAPINKKLHELVTLQHGEPAKFITIQQLNRQLGLR